MTPHEALPHDIARAPAETITFYLQLRRQGQSVNMAEMLALRAPPRARTDRELFEGQGMLDKQFGGSPGQLEAVVAQAQQHGYRPNPNDVYIPMLANYPGDPLAFVPATGGRNHIRRVCEMRGVSCQGSVDVKGRQPEQEVPAGQLDAGIANEIVDRQIAENPDLARVDRRDLLADAREKHGFRDDRRFGTLEDGELHKRRAAAAPNV